MWKEIEAHSHQALFINQSPLEFFSPIDNCSAPTF